MTHFIIKNTKNNEVYDYTESQVRNYFESILLEDKIIEKSEYEYVLNNPEEFFDEENIEEEKQNFIKYWSEGFRSVCDKDEYLKELIEAETWTSPRGIESVYEVIEVQ